LGILPWPGIAQGASEARNKPVVIKNVTVIDPGAATPVFGATVKIVGDKIESVLSSSEQIADSASVIDGTGKFLIPGLWDSHGHIVAAGAASLPLFLAYGVTGVRDVGDEPRAVLRLRTQTSSGELIGPRIITSGPILHGGAAWGTFDLPVNTAEEGARAVRQLRDWRVDFIKVHDNLSAEAYQAILKEAQAVGLSVLGHVTPSVTVWEAIAQGQVGIEHTLRIPLALSEQENALREEASHNPNVFLGYLQADQRASRTPSPAREHRLVEALRTRRVAICPTLTDMRALSIATSEGLRKDERFATLPASLQKEWVDFYDTLVKSSPEERAAYSELFRYALLWVGRFHKAGVVILAGTDAYAPGDFAGSDLHTELELLVLAGLSPLEALGSATIEPQVFHHLSAPGALIAPGKEADLVLLTANPLADIRFSRAIDLVIRRGTVFRPDYLKRLAQSSLSQQGGKAPSRP
jgi:imidazolonepropionase-like amidohydrolase